MFLKRKVGVTERPCKSVKSKQSCSKKRSQKTAAEETGQCTGGGIIVSPAYTYKECVKYWCSMRISLFQALFDRPH